MHLVWELLTQSSLRVEESLKRPTLHHSKPWCGMRSEKASKIRKRIYLLCVDNEKRKRYHNEEYAERCTKPDGEVRDLQSRESRMHDEGKSVSCQ